MPPLPGATRPAERIRQQAERAIARSAIVAGAVGLAAGLVLGAQISGVRLDPTVAGGAGALVGYAIRSALRVILDGKEET